ncbi:MFS transporter [Actinomadura fulvescens]
MMGIFSIVTTEILPIGLLNPIASGFNISEGTAGWMMTMPGIVAAIAAPAVTVATRRLDRRLMLAALMVLLALADFLSALAPTYSVMLIARVLVGITIGGFWSIGAGLAGRLVKPGQVSTATAVIFAAVPMGSVLGVPAGTLIGDLAGWRAPFIVMGVLTLGVLAALLATLPRLPAQQVTYLRVLRGLLRNTNIRIALIATSLIVIAHFGTYTYVTPFLKQDTHLDPGLISAFLLTYGAAGIAGNFIAGKTIPLSLPGTFITAAAMLAAATLLLPIIGTSTIGALGLLIVWGLAYGAIPASSQSWFSRSAPQTQEAATVLFTSSFQATFAIGALTGGIIVDATSPSTVMIIGAAVATLTATTLLALTRQHQPT